MVKTYKPSSISMDVKNEGYDIEDEDDIREVPLPTDWSLKKAEVFGSGVKIELARQDGGFVEVSPYPYPNQDIHCVNVSGRKWKVEGWTSAAEKAFDQVRQNTADEPYRVQGPHAISTQYSSDLQTEDHTEMIVNDYTDDTVDVECNNCGQYGLYLAGQSMQQIPNDGMEYEYECLCPQCGSEMTITEKHNI